MSYFRKLIYSFLITLVLAIPVSLEGYKIYNSYNSYKPILSESVKNPQNKTVDVVAHVGGYTISSLSGWASPFAEVSLSSQRISRKTMADENGFFIFNSVSLQDNPQELCLISQDVNQLPSFPLCLAPPPRNQNIEIQDILLSPTLSLEDGKIAFGKTAKASGMTFPRSKVQVYLFVEQRNSFWLKITRIFPTIKLPKISIVQSAKCKVQSCNSKFKVLGYLFNLKLLTFNSNFELLTFNFELIKSAFAANFPLYETESNENGYFEFSLPASTPSDNRIFVSAIFSKSLTHSEDVKGTLEENKETPLITNYSITNYFYSPKSNTLSFQIIGLWGLLKLFLQNLFSQAKAFFTNWNDALFIIMIEILILFGLLAAVLARKGEEKTKEVKEH